MASNKQITIYGQRLAWQVLLKICIDQSEKTEPILASSKLVFRGKLIIEEKDEAFHEANAKALHFELWCERSKFGKGDTGVTIV